MTRSPHGFALPSVMVALLIIEALVAVAFVAVLTWARAAGWGIEHARAVEAAEAGLARAVSTPSEPAWDTASGPVFVTNAPLPGGAEVSASLLRVGRRTVFVRSTGTAGGSNARAVLARVATRRPRLPLPAAALAYGGGIDLHGAVLARGQPADTSGWAPCGSPAAAADVVAVPVDTARAAFDRLPHERWRPFATVPPGSGPLVVLPEPVVADGRCDSSVWSNWGDPIDPLAPCGSHYTTVYYDGPLRIAGGRGQGLLVTGGDLTIGGDFRFHGLIAVRGRLVVEEPGATIVGTLLVGGVLNQRHDVRGTLAVLYAKCMVELGLPGTGAVNLLPGPSWLPGREVP